MSNSVIDNDYHPDDRLENDADQGHWGTQLLKSEMNYDKDVPYQRSTRGLAGGEALKISNIFRKNTKE